MTYVVIYAFGSYKVGDQITDQAAINAALASNPGYIVAIVSGITVLPSGAQTLKSGTDYSYNPAPIPLAGFQLLQTLNINPLRQTLEIEVQSSDIIQIVMDDGNGGNARSTFLNGAAARNQQGASYVAPGGYFKGRIRVYGPTSCQFLLVEY